MQDFVISLSFLFPLLPTLFGFSFSLPLFPFYRSLSDFTFWLKTFAETFAEPKLWSKYLLKLKSEVISLSENMTTNMDSLVN